jgi:hypothetical protein
MTPAGWRKNGRPEIHECVNRPRLAPSKGLAFRTTRGKIAQECTRVPFAATPSFTWLYPEGNVRVTAVLSIKPYRVFPTSGNARQAQPMMYAYPSRPFRGLPPYTARPRAGAVALLGTPAAHPAPSSMPVRAFVQNAAIRAIAPFALSVALINHPQQP